MTTETVTAQQAATPEAHAVAARAPHARADASATTIVAWGVTLSAFLVVIRAHVMGYGWYWLRTPLRDAPSVFAGSYLDLLYVAAVSVPFLLVLRFTRRLTIHRICRGSYALLAVLSLLLGMVNVEVVKMIGEPLNYPWLYYSGFLRGFDAQQAIAASLSWGIALGAAGTIVGMAMAAVLLRQLLLRRVRRHRLLPTLTIAGPLLGLCCLPAAAWFMRDFYHPALQNPVVVLVASMIREPGLDLFTADTTVEPDDFGIRTERLPQPSPTTSSAGAPSPTTAPAPPLTAGLPPVRNVLFLVLESVAAQYLPVYGGPYPIMPELNRYRDHWRLFRSIYAHAPNTNKSMVSILCSSYPWPTYRFLTKEHPDVGLVAISDVLKGQGYRTGLFYGADLRFGGAEQFLSHHNFDIVRDYRTINSKTRFVSTEKMDFLNGADDMSTADAMLDWLSSSPDADRPFFALMWTLQTHYPYYTTEPETRYSSSIDPLYNRYLNALREDDRVLGHILRTLDQRKLLDSTLIVIVGDHGEAFGQHGQFGHGNKLADADLAGRRGQVGHGCRLYEENIHVPLLLINRQLFKGEDDPSVGGMVDLGPTVLEALRLPAPGDWQGHSLLDPQRSQRTYFLAPWSGSLFGYREGDRKFIFDGIAHHFEAYDLAQDPHEARDLAPELDAARRDTIHQRLAAWVQYQDRLIRKAIAHPLPTAP